MMLIPVRLISITGVVSWKDCKTGQTPVSSETTLKAIFQAARVFPDGTDWNDDLVKN